jgi:surface antigen
VGGYGHVAYVSAVYDDGSILIEEYNWSAYSYGTRRLYPGGGYWPSNFINF